MLIFLAESDKDLRLGLQMLLQQESGLHVIGMAVQTNGLLVQLQASQADVLLIDWHLPGASIEELMGHIGGLEPTPKIAVLSVNPEDEALALAAGADAFISKNVPPDNLVEVVRWLRDSSSSGIGGS
jgi:DNA-binding NarL/FixJ family response regulator